ncbi:hypothetical protein M2254_000576 [Chryseobacterium sp. BIGb0186]|uniref:hypothetical protein n=2 Tax=Chryseobacterium group TaxID=2782232 RepID=UPI0024759194|nr:MULTISPECIES: hypothetical protein [Chryseobacterium]MBM7419070.1 hypothetical protein [Chryseobacterium sp. JUb44]MDH6208992.1 hypothetical protein [Chryseobacterium sp. BIGb0186]WSO11847.1 hypothetical protein VUJ64_08045 [Chryseobacterium scophthalmum]
MIIKNKVIKFISEKYYLILLVLVIGFIIFGFIHEKMWIKQMLKNSKYTIGIATTDWHQKNNNGTGTDYKYHFKDLDYFSITSYSYKKGDSFLIIFDSLKPKNNQVLWLYPIENYLIDLKVPKDGWKYNDVPFKIDSVEIRKKLTE